MENNGLPVILTSGELDGRHGGSYRKPCDCACVAQSNPAASIHQPLEGQYHCAAVERQQLSSEYTMLFGFENGGQVVVLNPPALKLWESFSVSRSPNEDEKSLIQRMYAAGIVQPDQPDLLRPIEPSNYLAAWLHITSRCNLRCAYCYVAPSHLDMSWEIGKAAIDTVFRSAVAHHYPKIILKFAGGEPLLRWDMVKKLFAYAQDRAVALEGVVLEGVVLTNGVLLQETIIEEMRLVGMQLMVSLDGLGPVQDSLRPLASGKGSFEAVQKGINLSQALGLTPDISVTVSQRNAAHLDELTAWLLEKKLPFSYNFYRECDRTQQIPDLAFDDAGIISGLQDAFRVIEAHLPEYNLLSALLDRVNLSVPHTATCGAGHNYLVFDPFGRTTACQMALSKPISSVQAEDPLMTLRLSDEARWHAPVDVKAGCQACQWRYYCTGGCPLVSLRSYGSVDSRSPNCAIYQALMPQVLRLEGLRLANYLS